MKLESITCPKCGAPLHFDSETQEYCFCSHCGTQVYKEDIHYKDRMDLEHHKLDVDAQIAAGKNKEEMMAGVLCIILAIGLAVFFIAATFIIH